MTDDHETVQKLDIQNLDDDKVGVAGRIRRSFKKRTRVWTISGFGIRGKVTDVSEEGEEQ